MAIPPRGRTSHSTYFITSSTYQKKALLQRHDYAHLLLDVINSHRNQHRLLLHEYVIMPDHFHLLLTPGDGITIERAMQCVKGGFSFRVKKEFGYSGEVWQTSFYDRRVRDWEEYQQLRRYIHLNPVRRHLVQGSEEFPFSSAKRTTRLDDVPQRLKPVPVPTL
jgi:putative transposase